MKIHNFPGGTIETILNEVQNWVRSKPDNLIPAGICLVKVNNRNNRTRCEICSKLTIKIPERRHSPCSIVSIVNFEHVIATGMVHTANNDIAKDVLRKVKKIRKKVKKCSSETKVVFSGPLFEKIKKNINQGVVDTIVISKNFGSQKH